MSEHPDVTMGGLIDQPTPIDVHGTKAWVLITRDYPLSSLHMTYAEANKLQADIRKVLTEHQVTIQDHDGPCDGTCE